MGDSARHDESGLVSLSLRGLENGSDGVGGVVDSDTSVVGVDGRGVGGSSSGGVGDEGVGGSGTDWSG